MNKRLIYSCTLILLAAATAFSQPVIKAQIPFPFYMGKTVLPSGSYTVDSRTGGTLIFRSADGKTGALILSNTVQSRVSQVPARLVFHRYGSQYFLSQVWTGDSNMGRELPRSPIEKEVAAKTKSDTRTLLATK